MEHARLEEIQMTLTDHLEHQYRHRKMHTKRQPHCVRQHDRWVAQIESHGEFHRFDPPWAEEALMRIYFSSQALQEKDDGYMKSDEIQDKIMQVLGPDRFNELEATIKENDDRLNRQRAQRARDSEQRHGDDYAEEEEGENTEGSLSDDDADTGSNGSDSDCCMTDDATDDDDSDYEDEEDDNAGTGEFVATLELTDGVYTYNTPSHAMLAGDVEKYVKETWPDMQLPEMLQHV